jgi:hypothetical protein
MTKTSQRYKLINQKDMHAHIYIYNAQKEAEMKFSCVPPKPELGKAWHGLSRNQGATRKHDEQYQMSTGT